MNSLLLNSAQLFLKGSDRNLDAGTVSSVVITGIVVVFIGLILLILLVYLYGKIFETVDKKKAQKAERLNNKKTAVQPNENVQALEPPVIDDGIDEEIIAVITGAISAMNAGSDKKLRLKSVKYAKPARPAWANAGIMENTKPF